MSESTELIKRFFADRGTRFTPYERKVLYALLSGGYDVVSSKSMRLPQSIRNGAVDEKLLNALSPEDRVAVLVAQKLTA